MNRCFSTQNATENDQKSVSKKIQTSSIFVQTPINNKNNSSNVSGSRRTNQYFAALAGNTLALGFGTMFAWSGTAWPSIRDSGDIGKTSSEQESWIGSIIILGALLSGFVTGNLNEKYGRRKVMLGLTFPCLFGWMIILFAQNFTMICIGRLLTGFAGGASSLVVPIYIAEISDPDIRGTLLAGYDFGIAFGFLYIAALGSFFSWKVQVLACATLAVVSHALITLIPESPRFLVSSGDCTGALKSLGYFHPQSTTLEHKLQVIKQSFPGNVERRMSVTSVARGVTWKDLLKPEILKPCAVAVMIHLLSSFSAEIPISAYTVDIFQSTAIKFDAYYATVVIAVIDVVSALIAAVVVDRFGRRPLLLFSQLTMTLSLASTATFFWVKEVSGGIPPVQLQWLPITSLSVFVFAFSIGTGPVSYMITGEILPPEAKGMVAGLINTVRWSSAFLVTNRFLSLMSLWGESVGYLVISGIALLGALYVTICVPETRGKTLEEIQLFYKNKNSQLPSV